MDFRFIAAVITVAGIFVGNPTVVYATESPSPATLEAQLLSSKYQMVIKDANVELAEREHRVCELHKIYATSALVKKRYEAANIVVFMKLSSPWYSFSEWRLEVALRDSANALARELTRRLRAGTYFPSRCSYREETGTGWFLQEINTGSKGEIAYALRHHLKDAKLPDNGNDPAIARRAEIRKAIEQYAAAIAPSLKKRWLGEAKGSWCDAAGALWHYLSAEAIEPARLGLTEVEARKLEGLARQ